MLDTFDIVIEISRQKFMNYILENVLVQNLPIVPELTWKASGSQGSLQAVLDSVDLSLGVGTDGATLNYHVYAATVNLTNQAQIGFTDGMIQVHFNIIPGTPFKIVLQSAEFLTSQTSQISDPNSFFQDVNSLLTGILDTQTKWDLFPNTPSSTALLIGFFFSWQISCLDANTVVAAIGQGNLVNVTNFLGFDDFAIGMAANLVKNNLLFPAVATLLDAQTVANFLNIPLNEAQDDLNNLSLSFINSIKPLLPAPFGSGSIKQTVQGVDIFYDFIDFNLANGFIKMDGQFHGETFCAHVHDGAFTEDITLSISNQQIVTNFTPNPPVPTYHVDFDFWCGLGFIFLASNVALVTGIVVTSILIDWATKIKVPQNKLSTSPFNAPAFDQVNWVGIQIFTEGLVLRGTSSAAVGYNVSIPNVFFNASIDPINIEDVGSGTYHFPGNLSCQAQDFQYEEVHQDVFATLFAGANGVLYPVKTTWKIHGQTLTSGSGQIFYNDLAHTATPPFNETALPNHQISIDYVISPGFIIKKIWNGLDNLQLTIPKSDYNFSVLVEMDIQDASGHSYSSSQLLDIQTDALQFGQDYLDWQKECGLATKINLTKIKTVPQGVLHGGDPLTPIDVTNIIKEVVQEQPAEASSLVKSLNATFGSQAVLKAFLPPANLETRGEIR